MSDHKNPFQPPISSRKPSRPAPAPAQAPRPAIFAEGSGSTKQPPAPRRRAVPEPPGQRAAPPRPAPLPVAPPPTNVIPISRARTAPPAGFATIADGWSIPKRSSSQAAVARAMPVQHAEAPPDTIVMNDPFSAFPLAPPAPTIEAPVPVLRPPQPLSMPLPAPVARPAKPELSDAERWAVFEQLGLGPKSVAPVNHKQMIINTYRGLGFAVLSIIVIVLVGYIAQTAFYFVSDSWVQPMVVSKTDEKVLALQSQVVAQMNERDKIVAELAQADRYIAAQQTFQAEFAAAIRSDLSGRKAALRRIKAIARDYGSARDRVRKSNSAYASSSRRKMAQEYAAGLIDRSDMLSGKYQLAQITTTNMGLAERQAEYETRAADLEQEAQALDAILNARSGEGGAISYEVLRIKQEFEMSRLESAKAIENREALKASLARQDAILDGLRKSPYLRAIEDGANVAFVPYGNMDNVEVGAPLYSCALDMLFCSKVGKVKEVLPGEVSFKHPHREKVLRGQMVEVELSDRDAGQDDILFVGGRPLLI